MDNGEMRVVFITASNQEEAARIAKALVAEKLAACVGIVPSVRSIYMWKGEVRDEGEVLMIVKTSATKFPTLAERVESLHSYDVPEVIAMPIVDGLQSYLDWIDETLVG
ncbi:MAG: divalent-cation tolerance protein CutA [Nitrospinota bacterium]|nr:divalent-cation tolerance protein CutA [Nitrospinota bacterium]